MTGQFGPTIGQLLWQESIRQERWRGIRRGIYVTAAIIVAVAALKYIFK